jgi:hypothetical protein
MAWEYQMPGNHSCSLIDSQRAQALVSGDSMIALPNARHARFAQGLTKGQTQPHADISARFSPNNARANASTEDANIAVVDLIRFFGTMHYGLNRGRKPIHTDSVCSMHQYARESVEDYVGASWATGVHVAEVNKAKEGV